MLQINDITITHNCLYKRLICVHLRVCHILYIFLIKHQLELLLKIDNCAKGY